MFVGFVTSTLRAMFTYTEKCTTYDYYYYKIGRKKNASVTL